MPSSNPAIFGTVAAEESYIEHSSSSRPFVDRPWSTAVPTLPRLSTSFLKLVPLFLGLLLFAANNLAPLAAARHPRAGYVPLFLPRNQDSAQYLTWIEASKTRWTIPDYHAPWQTEPALHVPLMWVAAKLSSLAGISATFAYLLLQALSYVLAFYALAFLLQVFTDTTGQAVLAVIFMLCAVPLRTLILIPALLLKPQSWLMMHSGYLEFLGGSASDGFFQGASCATSVTIGTAGALLSLALFGRYFQSGKKSDLWIASLVAAFSGFIHPFEFIPVTAAAALVLLWKRQSLRSVASNWLILGFPAAAVVLFYCLPTLKHPWLRIATEMNQLHGVHFSHHQLLALGLPVLVGVILAFWPPTTSTLEVFLACYVVISFLGMHAPFLPWPQHFKDGLDYAAAIMIARKIDQIPGLTRLWADKKQLRLAVVSLLLIVALVPHFYFRYLTYKIGATATEDFDQTTALAPADEARAISWLREHTTSDKLILAPLPHAPWMATVPMHSFASHWIFSLTDEQQAALAQQFFNGALSNGGAQSLLDSYGVTFVLIPNGSPGLRYLGKAELRWAGEKLLLYEFQRNEMQPFPELQKVAPGHYVWNPGPSSPSGPSV